MKSLGCKIRILMALLLTASGFAGCDRCDDRILSVRREMVDVGRICVGDSVSASFAFRNNSANGLSLNFMPECDCTTVRTGRMKLKPHDSGQLDVRVAVEYPGIFEKYVYVQADGSNEFLTVAVKGYAK